MQDKRKAMQMGPLNKVLSKNLNKKLESKNFENSQFLKVEVLLFEC